MTETEIIETTTIEVIETVTPIVVGNYTTKSNVTIVTEEVVETLPIVINVQNETIVSNVTEVITKKPTIITE